LGSSHSAARDQLTPWPIIVDPGPHEVDTPSTTRDSASPCQEPWTLAGTCLVVANLSRGQATATLGFGWALVYYSAISSASLRGLLEGSIVSWHSLSLEVQEENHPSIRRAHGSAATAQFPSTAKARLPCGQGSTSLSQRGRGRRAITLGLWASAPTGVAELTSWRHQH
jgi:hypothetical protein